MDTNANNNRESFEDQQVIFVDTHLIQKAVEGLQRAREEFQTLLEQAEGGDASVYYDLGVRYTEGDGTDKDPPRRPAGLPWPRRTGISGPPTCWGAVTSPAQGWRRTRPGRRSSFSQAAEQDYAPAQCRAGAEL